MGCLWATSPPGQATVGGVGVRSAEQSQEGKESQLGKQSHGDTLVAYCTGASPSGRDRKRRQGPVGDGTSHATGRCVRGLVLKLLAAGDDWKEGRASGRADQRPMAPPHHSKAEIFCVAILSGEAEGQGHRGQVTAAKG